MEMFISTPLGDIKIIKKGEINAYPGVYVILKKGDEEILLDVIEYDEVSKQILSVGYQPTSEAPVSIIRHDLTDKMFSLVLKAKNTEKIFLSHLSLEKAKEIANQFKFQYSDENNFIWKMGIEEEN